MKSLEIINLNVPFSKKMRGITHLTNGIKKNQVGNFFSCVNF